MSLFHDTTGFIHLVASVIALITGSYILYATKGTSTHKKVGYVYVVSMALLNFTALLIYRLFGKFAIFHWFALLSIVTILFGMIPIFFKVGKNYISLHISFMYWSVMGLYAAFVAEIFTRLPSLMQYDLSTSKALFFKMLNLAMFIVMGLGAYFFIKNKAKWNSLFSNF